MGIKYDSRPIKIIHEIIHLNIKIIELKKKNLLKYFEVL